MRRLTTGRKTTIGETDRNRPSEQGEDVHRIDREAAEVYICVSCDMLVNHMGR